MEKLITGMKKNFIAAIKLTDLNKKISSIENNVIFYSNVT